MPVTAEAQVVVAERLNHGLVIKFDDGRCAFYSAILLRDMLQQAEELDETRTDW